MKLLVQSDDYGITRGTARGTIRAIQNGPVRNTGLFANMPWAEEVTEWIRPYFEHVAFGIDLNMVNGPSLLGYREVPALCNEDGIFLSIKENRALDNESNGNDHFDSEQVYREFRAQIERFIRLVGKLPDYVHPHAYQTKKTEAVIRRLAGEYHIPYSMNFAKLYDAVMPSMGWYTYGTMEQQLNEEPLRYILEDRTGYLKHEYGYLITHCGELDSDTLRLPFNICRLRDLEAMTDPHMKQWIDHNRIELITFRDIKNQIL
ncbi:MAG: ChbG/HpnK family deacetylase [Solobacterium sp.]|nr:ChbG/HpnK family deacetylase [Solobacterium sp.]